MSKNKLFIFISLIVGLLVDLCLRLTTGEEGNLWYIQSYFSYAS